jgi:molecular chaperone DnaK (HSP70)
MASIGIDLGTTTTLFAEAQVDSGSGAISGVVQEIRQMRWNEGRLEEDYKQNYLPSVAFFPETGSEAGKVFVGVEARTRAAQSRDDSTRRLLRAVKRYMGRGLVLPPPANRTPAEVSALYLKHVIGDARAQGIFTDRDELTVTVPASFTTNQRRDTLHALQSALDELGMRRLDAEKLKRVLISEPVAALLDYVSSDLRLTEAHRNIDVSRRPRVLVYDMGGGTLDLTIVRLGWKTPGADPVLANLRFDIEDVSRYNQFAGEDFDLRIAKFLLDKLVERFPTLKEITLTDAEKRYLRNMLLEDAERLKVDLNLEFGWSVEDASLSFNFEPLVLQSREYVMTGLTVTGADYLKAVESFLQPRDDMKNATHPIDVFLKRNRLRKEDIDYFLLVGGMGQFIPLKNALREWWNRADGFILHHSPEKAVAQGAAVYSELKATDANFVIEEPAADAYYVKSDSGFSLLLDRGPHQKGQKDEYELSGAGDKLPLDIFAGDPPPPDDQSLEGIYPTLVYQGSTVVPLKQTYPSGTKVWIEMSYAEGDGTKVPHIQVWIGQPDNLVHSVQLNEL